MVSDNTIANMRVCNTWTCSDIYILDSSQTAKLFDLQRSPLLFTDEHLLYRPNAITLLCKICFLYSYVYLCYIL